MALRGSALSWKAGHEQSCDPCRMLDQRAQCPGMQEAKHAQLMRSRTMNSAPRVAVDGTRDSRKNGPAALCERSCTRVADQRHRIIAASMSSNYHAKRILG